MKKKILGRTTIVGLFLLALTVPAELLAQRSPQEGFLGGSSKVGTAAAQFLQIGVSARATAMGGSFVALVNDASAAYYNPGALAIIEKRQAMFNHTTLPAGLRHFFASYVQPVSRIGTFALSFIILTTGDIPVTVAFEGPTGETFSASESAIGISYAKRLTDKFSVGGTAKLIAEDLAGFTDRVVAFDLGTLYHTGFRQLTLGMAVSNFGPDIDFGTEKDAAGNVVFDGESAQLPITFRFGISVDVLNRRNSKVMVAGQLVQPNDNLRYETIGIEYSYFDTIFLRGGFKVDEENDEDVIGNSTGFSENFSAGAGVKASFKQFTGNFDFSWVHQQSLNNLLRFSVLLSF
ncbi:MAG: PorV/PorQ family protein [bacterium]